MALIVRTSKPRTLLKTLRESCGEEPIQGWICDEDGDFTRNNEHMKAWMRPRVSENQLSFYILGPKGLAISTNAYAIYHSKLLNLLLSKYDSLFDSGQITAMPTSGDTIGTND